MSTGLMLVSLALFVLARETQAGDPAKRIIVLQTLSGIALGLAFLTKETALLWLPLPLIVVLCSARQARRRELGQLGAFYGGLGLPVVWWFFSYHRQTGNLFLLGIPPGQLVQPLILAAGLCALLAVSVVSASHLLPPRQRLQLEDLSLNQPVGVPGKGCLVGVVVFLGFSLGMTLALAPKGQPIVSLQDALGRFAAIPEFFERQVFPTQPLLPVAIITLLAILVLSFWRKQYFVLVLSALLYLPLVYLVSSPSHDRWWTARQLLGLYLVSYVALGLVGAEIIQFLSLRFGTLVRHKSQRGRKVSLVPVCAVMAVVLASLGQSGTRAWHYDQDPYEGTWFGYEVQDTAAWLRATIPPGTSIMVSLATSYSLQFLTESMDYQYVHIPMSYRSTMEEGKAGWYLGSFADRQIPVSNPLYVRDYSGDPPRFFAISLSDLLKEIESNQVEYLIVRSEDVRYASQEEIQFFRDCPVFEQVYQTTGQNGQALRVYKVKWGQSGTVPLNYPVTLHRKSLDLWRQRIADGSTPYTEYELYRALGQHGILIEGSSPSFDTYVHLGDVFREHKDWKRAAFEYRLALDADPTKADQILILAQSMIVSQPDDGALLVLLGAAYSALNQDSLARGFYTRALQAPDPANDTQSAALRGLAKLDLASGDYPRSIQEFEQSTQLSAFGSADSRRQLLMASGHLYQAKGQIDEAIRAYWQAINSGHSGNPSEVNHEPFEPRAFDFVRQFDRAQIRAASEDSVHPAVFIIEGEPEPVLFAHPPAEISYTVGIPARASLRFAPVIAPEVWQLSGSDGIQFEVYIDNGLSRHNVFSEHIEPKDLSGGRVWSDREIELSPWSGQTVTITFVTGPGPRHDDRYDWAGWRDPRIAQPVAYDFAALLPEAEIANLGLGQAKVVTQTIGSESRTVLYQHPTSRVTYSLLLPSQSALRFGLGLDPAVWSPDKGDGLEYNVYVRHPKDPLVFHQVFHRYIDPKNNPNDRRWFDERVDLGRFGGQVVDIIFEALPGPAGDGDYDWGGWSTPVLIDETLPENQIRSETDTLRNPP
jgi:tetratricopeptide (TPR) repeat protein